MAERSLFPRRGLPVLVAFSLACLSSCKSFDSPSETREVTTFSPGNSVDLTGYMSVGQADYIALKDELNTWYAPDKMENKDITSASLYYIEGISDDVPPPNIPPHAFALAGSFDRYSEIEKQLKALLILKYDPYLNIPLPELVAIRAYTGNDYWTVNKALRTSDVSQLINMQGFIRSASSGLNKLPNFEGITKRGVSQPPDRYQKSVEYYAPGKHVIEKAFVSTTSLPQPTFGLNVKFTIHSKYGKDIHEISEIPSENEVLFVPGSEFIVKDAKKTIVNSLETLEIELDQVPTGAQAMLH